MMNRRAFIEITMAFAAAVPVAVIAADASIVPAPPPARWTPTPEEVALWLEYYQAYRAKLRPDIHDISTPVQQLYNKHGHEVGGPREVPEDPMTLLAKFQAFEMAFEMQEHDRNQVAVQFIAGYEAGRDGAERYCGRFERPSNSAYAWYHYWQVGHEDHLYALAKLKSRR
jgi:hypothetical protein